jgi:hypothetical protein
MTKNMALKVNTKKIKTITFHRNPTEYEIKFGYGAIHYKDFDVKDCLKKDGTLKKWLVCPVDGLRYYY